MWKRKLKHMVKEVKTCGKRGENMLKRLEHVEKEVKTYDNGG